MAASERDEARRERWRALMRAYAAGRLVFVDESGTHLALSPRYAWAPRGKRAEGRVPRNWGKNTTLVAGLSLSGVRAPWTLEGAITSAAFAVYVREVLAPTLEPGEVVVIDNLAAHRRAEVRAAIEARGAELIFLPPYSPDLSPIEEAFSTVKAMLRRAAARTREALLDAIAQALAAVTPEDALGWFTHAGYLPIAQSP